MKLTLKNAKIVDGQIYIDKIELLDNNNNFVREAKINDELIELIKRTEINAEDYINLNNLIHKNPNIKKLINTFDLNF
jgi:hypothetical protein